MSECVLCSGDSSKLSGAFEIYEPDEWLLNAAGYLQGAETWSFSYKGMVDSKNGVVGNK